MNIEKIIRRTTIVVFALTAFACANKADAATGTAGLTFTRPVSYTDGSALASSDITGYQVSCTFTPTSGVSSACTAFSGSPLSGGTNQTGTLSFTVPAAGGSACFVVKTMVGSAVSAGSSPTCKTFSDTRTPSDPTGVTVTITLSLQLNSASQITVANVGKPVVTVKTR